MRGRIDPEREAGDPIKLLLIFPALSLLISCNQPNKIGTREIAVIPKPQAVTYRRGDFILSQATRLKFDQADIRIKEIAGQISQALRTSVLPDRGSGVIDLGIDDNYRKFLFCWAG